MNVRILVAVSVISVFAGAMSSHANVSFKWSSGVSSAQYWYNSSSPSDPHVYSNAPSGSTVLTYISGDQNIDFDTGSSLQQAYGSGLGSDVFVGATNSLNNGRYTTGGYTIGAAGSGAGSYVGSYAYVIFVYMPFATFKGTYGGDIANLPVGTLYGVSTIVGRDIVTLNPLALHQYDTDPLGKTESIDVGTVRADIALVPEPSTFALLGIGLGLVGLRRFRRK